MTASVTQSAADIRILQALHRYYYLTPAQVCRLFYSPTSMTYVWSRLNALTAQGLLLRLRLSNTGTRGGSAASVYTLSTKGQRSIATEDTPRVRRPRSTEEQVKAKNSLFMAHTLLANDFLISAELVSRNCEVLELVDMLSEGDMKRAPVPVVVAGKKQAVAVDGWLNFHIRGEEQACICLELDRGTEAAGLWKHKVHSLVVFAKGAYQAAFGTEAISIAVVATPGVQRQETLCRWTEQELTRLGETHEADLFRFLAGEPTAYTPEALFLSPVWRRPFDKEALPLIEL